MVKTEIQIMINYHINTLKGCSTNITPILIEDLFVDNSQHSNKLIPSITLSTL